MKLKMGVKLTDKEKMEQNAYRKKIGASVIMAHCTLLRESSEAINSHTKKVRLT